MEDEIKSKIASERSSGEGKVVTRGPKEPKSRGGRRILAFFIGLTLLVVAAGAVWYFAVVAPAERAVQSTSERVGQLFGELFGQKVKVTQVEDSSVLKVSEIGEIALMEFDLKVHKEVVDEQVVAKFFSSSKKLRMEGKFKVKIGYQIADGLTLDSSDGRATIQGLGEPVVLSAEMVSVRTLEDKNGVWNKIGNHDRDRLTKELRLQAMKDVKASGMMEALDALMKTNLRGLLGVEDVILEGPIVEPLL